MITKIKATVYQKTKNMPSFINIDFFQDESEKIVSQVSDLENNVILATIIVFIITLFFMGWKSSILVSMSIPFSFLL